MFVANILGKSGGISEPAHPRARWQAHVLHSLETHAEHIHERDMRIWVEHALPPGARANGIDNCRF